MDFKQVPETIDDYINEVRRPQAHKDNRHMYTYVQVRNDVLIWLNSEGEVPKSELVKYIKSRKMARRGERPHRSWIHKNARYFNVRKRGNTYYFSLSIYGTKALNQVKGAESKYDVWQF